MNKSTDKNSVLDHIDLSDYPKELKIESHNDIDYRGSLIAGISIIVLIFTLLSLFLIGRYFDIYPILYILVSFFYILSIIFVIIPQTLISAKFTLRTKSTVFAREWFFNFLLLVLSFIMPIAFFPSSEDYSLGSNLLQVVYWFGMCLFFFQQNCYKRKPLVWNVKMSISSAPIVSVHSIEIKEELDGYSQRPISSEFQELDSLIPSSTNFVNKIEEFCVFLGKRGELIDWCIEESFAILYPRFIIKIPNLFKNPLFYYQLLKKVRLNEELTSVEITLSPPQISININFHDYETLNRETTFHTLCLSIIESVKKSLTAFLNNDLDAAYHELTRGRESDYPWNK